RPCGGCRPTGALAGPARWPGRGRSSGRSSSRFRGEVGDAGPAASVAARDVHPSGVGKSTLLEVVLGLLRPDSGEVLVEGNPLRQVRRWRGRIGYVPQHSALVPGTVRDNLAWSLQ